MDNRVGETRKRKNITQQELAMRSSISRTYLSNIETWKQKEIGSTVMFNIATALGVDISDIFFKEVVVLTQRRRKKHNA
jgi:transcriptional regulator with XRE-family HTH domain